MQQGIQDTSRGGAYHNKKFRDAATARDLNISYDKRIGWSITQPTDALCEFILDQGWTDIQMNRIEWSFAPRGAGSGNAAGGETGKAPTTNRNSHHRKYVCPCCGNSVRGHQSGKYSVHGLWSADGPAIKKAGSVSPRHF